MNASWSRGGINTTVQNSSEGDLPTGHAVWNQPLPWSSEYVADGGTTAGVPTHAMSWKQDTKHSAMSSGPKVEVDSASWQHAAARESYPRSFPGQQMECDDGATPPGRPRCTSCGRRVPTDRTCRPGPGRPAPYADREGDDGRSERDGSGWLPDRRSRFGKVHRDGRRAEQRWHAVETAELRGCGVAEVGLPFGWLCSRPRTLHGRRLGVRLRRSSHPARQLLRRQRPEFHPQQSERPGEPEAGKVPGRGGRGTASGTRLQLWSCAGTTNQTRNAISGTPSRAG
ncbi:hypothetical protein BX266_5523 [Streptomyces sp. TLI_171]|nr:hypothetical protein BX266_5523 [Streptomyces sp. TLI_171]